MRSLFCIPLLLALVSNVRADDPDAEVARLRDRVATLEAENQKLRQRLAQIAALSTVIDDQPSPSLGILLGSDDWGDAQKSDIMKVLYSSADPIWTSAGKPPLHRIVVLKSSKGPLVAYDRGPANTYNVHLDVQGRLWARFAYQFSHEVCHILANYRNVPNQQKWLEESICETASLYALRAMGQSWKTDPPYPNWNSYADSLTQYANDRIDKAQADSDTDLGKWYADNKSELDTNSTNRDLNLVVAVRLLEIFEQHPNSWRIIRSLNSGDPVENQSLVTYLTGWHSRVADSDKPTVKQIAELFGVTLH